MAAGANKLSSALTLENDESAAFLKPQSEAQARFGKLKEQLDQAVRQPDVNPAEAMARPAPPLAAVQAEQPLPAPSVQPPTTSAEPQRAESPAPANVTADEMSLSIPARETPNKGGRPMLGKERKVERTISMDRALDKHIQRLSNREGIRLDKNVSAASVAVHLMLYALSHMRDNAVFPTDDGMGLHIEGFDQHDPEYYDRLVETLAVMSKGQAARQISGYSQEAGR